MGSYQDFHLDELQADTSRSYAEFLRRPGISMGMYHIPAGGKDPQHPHQADEVYVVLNGRAELEVDGDRIDVGRGRIVSVDRGVEHRFVDVVEDLSVLVVFAPPATPQD
ncbi:MAG TPA: cupin domain-containing protein [Pseudonocardia sp.]|nr:cupin domain-containing protein [Pseudonocardia sp.]